VKFPLTKIVFNWAGLLIGAVETTSHAVNNILREVLERQDVLNIAREAAAAADPTAFDGVAREALRFRPAFPYFFRTCHRSTTFAAGTPFEQEIQPGTTVLAVTHSAMFDDSVFPRPDQFDPGRSHADTFTFGQGLHSCLGRAIAGVMVPEIARQCIRRRNLRATGPMRFKGGVPDSYPLAWDT
jgi:cytochrome P450